MGRSKDHAHLVRMAMLFGVGIAMFLVAQLFLVPKGFGAYGHYRPGALDDARARPLHYAGRQACAECHGDKADMLKAGPHHAIGCEACHGPLLKHASAPDQLTPKLPDPRATCLNCHLANPARPPKQPQIVPADHSESGPCTECHKPHDPRVS